MSGPKGGRPRKPTQLRVIHGDRADRVNRREPQPTAPSKAPRPPKAMSPEARKVWRRVAPILWRANVLTDADLLALEQLCESAAIVARVRDSEGLKSLLVKERGGVVRTNPLWRIARDADARLNAWLREFGMTPSARSGLALDVNDDVEGELERRLGG
ncbi:MAG TPA: phage terminase small subunit P27 family [Candidatus Limnocylindria bacterium]|nr:phage terminase small subunit P27 family [Candidatus Limnocylindria bacterium]